MPWNEAETGSEGQGRRKLKIGCYDDDGFFECTPGMRRAVREAAEALRARGHAVEEWRPDGLKEAFALNGTFRNADGGRTFLELLKGKYSTAPKTFLDERFGDRSTYFRINYGSRSSNI